MAGGVWARARTLAQQTPDSRNRYVDFLRALSILAVIIGHWLIAAPWMDNGQLRLDHMLSLSPWTRWLTWLFQVMPIFFIVGGYSNAASWEAARNRGTPYSVWIMARLRRLAAPLMPLLVLWSVIAILAYRYGVSAETIRIGSQTALVPTWFLAVYVLVILLVPLTTAAWERWGLGSFWGFAGLALLVDAAAFAAGYAGTRWLNYIFVWTAVHQLGYHWRAGGMRRPAQALPWSILGLALLAFLILVAHYPLSMVGVPGQEISNTLPPTLAMLGLALLQVGLLLSLQGPARRLLDRTGPWTATIVINGMIMTIYLWHLTAMTIVIGTAWALGGLGLAEYPGTGLWWGSRPLWMGILALVLLPLVALFVRFERLSYRQNERPPAMWQPVLGAVLLCTGLALTALDGLGDDNPLGLRLPVVASTFIGGALILIPRPRS